MSPLSPGERTDTGTIARSVLPFVGSPRSSKQHVDAPRHRRQHDVVHGPPESPLIVRNTSNGRSAVANRRLGPTLPSNGPRGGVPIPATVRSASAVAADALREDPRLPRHVGEALERVQDHLLHRVADQVLRRRGGLGGSTPRRAPPSGASGARSNNADAIIIPPIPSAIAWWSFSSTAVRPSARSSKT